MKAYALVNKKVTNIEDAVGNCLIDEYWPLRSGFSYLCITRYKKQAEQFVKNNPSTKFIQVEII